MQHLINMSLMQANGIIPRLNSQNAPQNQTVRIPVAGGVAIELGEKNKE